MKTSLIPSNAILFVFDVSNANVEIPEYKNDTLVGVTESCVSVGTQAETDGEVVVELGEAFSLDKKLPLCQVFSGVIETPGKQVAVVTSEFDIILENNVIDTKTKVSIFVDDKALPSAVLIEIR